MFSPDGLRREENIGRREGSAFYPTPSVGQGLLRPKKGVIKLDYMSEFKPSEEVRHCFPQAEV